jgi:hypothetical protein
MQYTGKGRRKNYKAKDKNYRKKMVRSNKNNAWWTLRSSSSPSNDNSVLWRTLPKGSFFSHLSEWRIPQRGYFFLSLMGFKPMIQSSSMSTKQTNALSHLEQTWRFAWRHAKKEKIFFLYDLSLLAYYIKLILSSSTWWQSKPYLFIFTKSYNQMKWWDQVYEKFGGLFCKKQKIYWLATMKTILLYSKVK